MLITLIAFYALATVAFVCVYLAFRMRSPRKPVAADISAERKRRAMLSFDAAYQQYRNLR